MFQLRPWQAEVKVTFKHRLGSGYLGLNLNRNLLDIGTYLISLVTLPSCTYPDLLATMSLFHLKTKAARAQHYALFSHFG